MNKEKLSTLVEKLIDTPSELSKIQFAILEKTKESDDLAHRISNIESTIKIKINSKTDENGKKLYSNAEAREAAFNEIKESDVELAELLDEKSDLTESIQRLRIEYDQLSNEQRNARALLQFFSDKIDTLD